MKVAVLGQGSIGRRHAALLTELGHQAIGYDVRDTPPVEGVARAPSEAAALADAAAAIVASPPHEHLRHARLALDHGVHALVEKPFAPSAQGVAELGALARRRGLVLGVAMNMRFHPGVSTVRRLLAKGAIGRPLRASAWFGSWLPGWRPGVDYRDLYSARRELGGGVLLDAIHEIDYLLWMLGPIRRVRGVLAHVSTLELDVEDLATLVAEHVSGSISTLTLDYLDRGYNRGCRVIGEEGTLAWSWTDEAVVRHSHAGEAERVRTPSDVQPTYRAQLECFLSAIADGGPPATGVADAVAALAVTDAARRASTSGRVVDVLDVGNIPPTARSLRSA